MPTQANTTQAITIVAYFPTPLFIRRRGCAGFGCGHLSQSAQIAVDVVQAVGRVMRKAPDKQWGYVILPVVIPAGLSPEASLDDNKNYKVVWQVLQALRAHDERFNAMINQIELNKNKPDKIQVIGVAFNDPPGQYTGETPKITPTLPFHNLRNIVTPFLPKLFLNVAVADIGRNGRKMSAKSPKPTLPAFAPC